MEAYVLDRHYKLWEENNKLLKRVVFVTIAISVALIVKVLVPFVDDSGIKKPVMEKIDSLGLQKDATLEKIRLIEKTESILKDVNKYIEKRPWQKEKEELIQKYRSMRNDPSSAHQSVADDTIRKISQMLKTNVLTPLQKSGTAPAEGNQNELVRLNTEIKDLENYVGQWERQYIGKNWYRTIGMKELAMRGLQDDLNQRMRQFSDVVRQELDKVKQERVVVTNELTQLNTEITTESEKLKALEKELQDILPQWLRGLVKIEQVIQLLPVFLLVVAVYVFVIGIGLTRHFQAYASGKGLAENEITNPVMSSIWTLVPRGRYGTVQVVLAYGLFFLCAWLLLEKAVDLLLVWMSIDDSHAWLGAQTPWEVFLWLSRAGLLCLLIYVVVMPWRSKRGS